MVSSFKLGDEISSSKTWSKRFAFLEDISHLLANQSAFFQVDSLDTCATSTGRRSFSRSRVYSGVNSVRDVSGNPRYFRVSKPLRIARVKKSGRADICHKAADLPTEPAASEARDRRHTHRDEESPWMHCEKAAVKKLMKRAPGRRRPSPRRSPRPNRWRCR